MRRVETPGLAKRFVAQGTSPPTAANPNQAVRVNGMVLRTEVGDNNPKDPLISPIYGTFEDLPPIYVLVSDSEMLLDDSLRLARKAHMYQSEVRVDVWRKVPHVWVSMPFLPESREGIRRIGQYLKDKMPC